MIESKVFINQSEGWLDWRKQFITGTEVAALFGLNPYKKPKDLFAEKIKGESNFIESTFVKIGRLLEPVIIDFYDAEDAITYEDIVAYFNANPDQINTKKKLVKVFCDTENQISCSLDGMLDGNPLECKSMYYNTFYKKNEGLVPNYYLLQLLIQMRVLKKKKGYIGILLNLPENLAKLIKEKNFKLNFKMVPLIIEELRLIEIKYSGKKIFDLIDKEVKRFFDNPEEYKVDRKNKQLMLELLGKIGYREVENA